jgi:FMN phosphatase YigB (HAD superfamily)
VAVFDLGKVLVDFDYGLAAEKLSARSRLTGPEILRALGESPLLLRYETGLISTVQFFEELSALTGFRGGLDSFADSFGDIFSPMPRMIELHAALRRQGMPTFAFSNTNDLAIRHLRRRFPFFSQFDGCVLSFEHGVMKPDARLYEVVERQCGRRGAEILYLDDRPENISAGAARGWRVVLQESPERTWAQIESLGLLPPVAIRA